MNQGIKKLFDKFYEKEHESVIDIRGLLVHALIHCQGSQTERQAALMKVYQKIREWSGSHSTAQKIHYEDLLRIIVCFAT